MGGDGQPLTGVDGTGPHHGKVRPEIRQRRQGCGAPTAQARELHRAAGGDHHRTGFGAHLHGSAQGHAQRGHPSPGECTSHHIHRGPVVQDDRHVVANQTTDQVGNGLLAVGILRGTQLIGQRRPAQVHGHRSPMDPTNQAVTLQFGQVTTDGHGGGAGEFAEGLDGDRLPTQRFDDHFLPR